MKYSILLVFLVLVGCSYPIELTKAPEMPGISQEIEKEFIMVFKPIAEFPAYFTVGNQVKGVDGNKLVPVKLIEDLDGVDITRSFHDFMFSDEIIYFKVMTYVDGTEPIPNTDPVQYKPVEKILRFEQDSGTVTEISEGDYLLKSVTSRITMEESPFKIEDYDNKGTIVSSITQYIEEGKVPRMGFIEIDGYTILEGNMWFTVPTGPKGADPGIWFAEKGVDKYVNILKAENCRIWK